MQTKIKIASQIVAAVGLQQAHDLILQMTADQHIDAMMLLPEAQRQEAALHLTPAQAAALTRKLCKGLTELWEMEGGKEAIREYQKSPRWESILLSLDR